LVKITYDITGGVQSACCCALMLVNLEVPSLTARCPQSDREVRSHIASQSGIQEIHTLTFTVGHNDSNAILTHADDPFRLSPNPDAGLPQLG
jgi:hypothetical protein